MRDRLIELLLNVPKLPVIFCGRAIGKTYQTAASIADHLLANGVIVPPCKVGDKVFFIVDMSNHKALNDFVIDDTITKIGVTTKGILQENSFDFSDFGKTVFLTREEAEKALSERSEV